VLQEDDEWEESEEAWELGEAGGMIVGAVRQEDEYSWQDACDTWAAQDGEMEASVHQVEAGQSGEDEHSEAEGLLVEGEEREYVLELLMREVPPNLCASAHPARAEFATLKGKRKRNLGNKLRKRLKMARGAAIKEPRREGRADTAGKGRGQVTGDLSRNPEVRGGGLTVKKQDGRDQPTVSLPTSGGECSG
jgi:hypothetical protein